MSTLTAPAKLGVFVRAERIRRGIDQRDLAETAGVGLTLARRLESGAGSSLTIVFSVLNTLGIELSAVPSNSLPRPLAGNANPHAARVDSILNKKCTLSRREDRATFELNRAVAYKLRQNRETVIVQARKNRPLVSRNSYGSRAQEWVSEWEKDRN